MTPLQAQLIQQIPELRRLARTFEQDRAGADDLVQETLVRALRKLDLYVPNGAFVGWLATIMRNIFIDRARRRKIKPEEALDRVPQALEPCVEEDPLDRLMLRELNHAIGELPTAQRQILLLVAIHGMTYEAVAARLALPLGTVRSRLFRARECLMRKLDPTLGRHPRARVAASAPARRPSAGQG